MDYHVFLLSRIKERWDETGDNHESVAFGLRSTGRLITGAALIMVAVFAGFASGELVMFQQVGFGLGVAILLDATVIRSVLVPASMKLLGAWNWYFPTWLEWLPAIQLEPLPGEAPVGEVERSRGRADRVVVRDPATSREESGRVVVPEVLQHRRGRLTRMAP